MKLHYLFYILTASLFWSTVIAYEYEIRVAFWQTRSYNRLHWSLLINSQCSRAGVQIDIINDDKSDRSKWKLRIIPTASLDYEGLSGSYLLGNLPLDDFPRFRSHINGLREIIADGQFNRCKAFIVYVATWSNQPAQNWVSIDKLNTLRNQVDKDTMDSLRELYDDIDWARHVWGEGISKHDTEKGFSGNTVDQQMLDMNDQFISKNDDAGLTNYLTTNDIDLNHGIATLQQWKDQVTNFIEDFRNQEEPEFEDGAVNEDETQKLKSRVRSRIMPRL